MKPDTRLKVNDQILKLAAEYVGVSQDQLLKDLRSDDRLTNAHRDMPHYLNRLSYLYNYQAQASVFGVTENRLYKMANGATKPKPTKHKLTNARKQQPWQAWEIKIVRQLYRTETRNEIAHQLERSEQAVIRKIREMKENNLIL